MEKQKPWVSKCLTSGALWAVERMGCQASVFPPQLLWSDSWQHALMTISCEGAITDNNGLMDFTKLVVKRASPSTFFFLAQFTHTYVFLQFKATLEGTDCNNLNLMVFAGLEYMTFSCFSWKIIQHCFYWVFIMCIEWYTQRMIHT